MQIKVGFRLVFGWSLVGLWLVFGWSLVGLWLVSSWYLVRCLFMSVSNAKTTSQLCKLEPRAVCFFFRLISHVRLRFIFRHIRLSCCCHVHVRLAGHLHPRTFFFAPRGALLPETLSVLLLHMS